MALSSISLPKVSFVIFLFFSALINKLCRWNSEVRLIICNLVTPSIGSFNRLLKPGLTVVLLLVARLLAVSPPAVDVVSASLRYFFF